jgi:hypothetical protein
MFIRILFALFLFSYGAGSPGAFSRGLNTTFDPNRWGGASAIACLTAAIGGTCSTGFNAACDGVSDDTTAWNNFINYAITNDPVVLYIPPGKHCLNVAGNGFILSKPGATAHVDGTPIKNLTIWAYGASFDSLFIGTQNVPFPDNTHQALLSTTHANDSTLTLLSSGDAALFTANVSWIIVSCLSLQRNGGYPPNWSTFEYHLVTNVAGSTLTLDSPLKYACKSTYPQADLGDSIDVNQGGPASAYVLNAAWNSNITICGLTVTQQANAVFGAAKTTTLINFNPANPNGIAPSMALTYTVINSEIGSPEFDKNVDTMVMQNVTGQQFIFQSASFNNVTMANINARVSVNGTPGNATINDLTTPLIRMGPTGFGHGTSFTISNSSIGSAEGSNICMPSIASGNTDLTFGTGTFTMPKTASSANRNQLFAWAVPGQKYYFADGDGSNNSSPQTHFQITDFREDASNYYVDTDIVGALPTPTCNMHSCPCYTAYQASSVTQLNTGPADLTQFAAPP